MRSWMIILAALFCLSARAEEANLEKVLSASDSMNEEELVNAAEAISKGNEGSTTKDTSTLKDVATTTTTASASTTANLPESQIPLFPKGQTVEKANTNPYWRVAASMIFILVIAGGTIYVARRRAVQRSAPGSSARIEVLHQHYFGPKRGLALVRVAGEVMLISMTDQNINMMKSIALIDDEVSGLRSKDFNNFLEDEFTVGSVQDALRARA